MLNDSLTEENSTNQAKKLYTTLSNEGRKKSHLIMENINNTGVKKSQSIGMFFPGHSSQNPQCQTLVSHSVTNHTKQHHVIKAAMSTSSTLPTLTYKCREKVDSHQ